MKTELLDLLNRIKRDLKKKKADDQDHLEICIARQNGQETWWYEGKTFAEKEIIDYIEALETEITENSNT